MKFVARLFALSFLLSIGQPAPAQAAAEFVVIGSGEEFSFARHSEFKVNDQSFTTYERIEGSATGKRYFHHSRVAVDLTSKIEIQYQGKTHSFVKTGSKSGFSNRKEAEEQGPELADALTRGEMLALTLMKKNVAVADDTAGVIQDKPYHLVRDENFPFDARPAKFSFRYALVLETNGEKLVSYKFIRQGLNEE